MTVIKAAHAEARGVGIDLHPGYPMLARAASTANITLSAPGATIDGVTMAVGDVFLPKNQTSAGENGLYVWNGAAVAATRHDQFDTATDWDPGLPIFVLEGTANAQSLWRHTTTATITLGTTALTFRRDGSPELGLAQITADITTTSTTVVDATGLSVAVTIGTRPVEVMLSGYGVHHSVAGERVRVEIFDTTAGVVVASGEYRNTVASLPQATLFLRARLAPTSGARSYKARWWVPAAGTGTLMAAATYPATLTVREV